MTAQRMSKATLTTYSAAVGQLDDFLAAQDMPRAVVNIGREHLEAFIADLLGTWKPYTVHDRYRALRTFFTQAEHRGDPWAGGHTSSRGVAPAATVA